MPELRGAPAPQCAHVPTLLSRLGLQEAASEPPSVTELGRQWSLSSLPAAVRACPTWLFPDSSCCAHSTPRPPPDICLWNPSSSPRCCHPPFFPHTAIAHALFRLPASPLLPGSQPTGRAAHALHEVAPALREGTGGTRTGPAL